MTPLLPPTPFFSLESSRVPRQSCAFIISEIEHSARSRQQFVKSPGCFRPQIELSSEGGGLLAEVNEGVREGGLAYSLVNARPFLAPSRLRQDGCMCVLVQCMCDRNRNIKP